MAAAIALRENFGAADLRARGRAYVATVVRTFRRAVDGCRPAILAHLGGLMPPAAATSGSRPIGEAPWREARPEGMRSRTTALYRESLEQSRVTSAAETVCGRLPFGKGCFDDDATWSGAAMCCTCYHPLFVFNQFGDLERSLLRPCNVHSADGWRDVLEPVTPQLFRGI